MTPKTLALPLAEHLLPVLLILGLFARISALLVTLVQGPGRLSLDHWLRLDTPKA